ncbi:redoxin domain-containing protein [Haloprofundus sp. MHR1]|uniref:redoxin domain-containing protein n=1 Tax=Haloprofundus sp. MHR1 TaxID=2572921 RepID=UPI0010BEDE82|nr:redoxin domain-containing protein [Haloprofundus sp. MHR1]QCJ47365.1 redoxin domain-containing protein [Haloprofundus sp. MHR1]
MAEHVGVEVGESAPDVTGQLVRPDGEVDDVSLAALAAEKPVLLSFYTADFSPDCIEEWCSFRDFDWFSTGERVQVVGVSKSGVRTHRQFINRLNLGFPLYSDGDLDIAEAFDVAYRAFGISRRARRSCFLLDESMTVRYRWVGDHWLDPTRDTPPVGEIHEAIQAELGGDEEQTFGF